MPAVAIGPYLNRLCVMRCRLSYAQQRIRELEELVTNKGIELPGTLTAVPPITHDCFQPVSTASLPNRTTED